MTMHSIAIAEARSPAPFTSAPSLVLVLAAQSATGAHYVQARQPHETMEMLRAEAQALETVGEIDSETLARDWTLVDGVSDIDIAMAREDVIDANVLDEGAEVEEEETIEDYEPLV